jgi:autotransporter-associated beta strand protein
VIAAVCLGRAPALAADVPKADNTDALIFGSSWTNGTGPTPADVAVWDGTVTGSNTVAAGGSLSWGGIRVANPGGAVVITNLAGDLLTLGTSGIDMSAATQNLTIFNSTNTTGSIAVADSQQWSVAAGRTLTLFATSNSANQRLTGTGSITVTGGGVVNMLVGDAGSTTFTAGNGNDTYTGNWAITGGSKVISLRNGTHAWGQGTITLDNGIMSQSNGNWSFSNAVVVAAGGGTFYSDSTGTSRYMNLTGPISGSGAVAFNAIAAMSANEGFILTGSNTFTGPMTINPNATVRIGGGATTTLNSTASGTLGSLDPAVAITNNGILGFGWTDARTVSNVITGTGIVRLGRSGGVLPATQVITLTAANTYTGTTQVNAGRLNLVGSLTAPITVASGASLSGTGSTTGRLTLANGGGLLLGGGTTTTGLTVNGATFTGTATGTNQVTFASPPVTGATYDVVTYGGGGLTGLANLKVMNRGTTTNTGSSVTFTSGEYGAVRTWNTTSGTWNAGVTPNFAEGDQLFYNGDRVVFGGVATSSTVTIAGTLQPGSVTVSNTANAYSFTGGAIGGTTSLVKANAGVLRIGSVQSYTGGTTLDGGTLQLAASASGTGAVRGVLTANPGTTIEIAGADVFGFGGGATAVNTVNLVGATLVQTQNRNETNTAVFNLSGGATVAATGGVGALFDMFGGTAAVNSTGDVQNTISAPLRLRQNDTTFTVADGAAATDLLVSGAITRGSEANGTLVKAGAGTMVVAGAVTGSTSVSVTAGTLALTSAASTYSGGSTLNGGVLSFTSLGSGPVAVNGGTLQWQPGNALDVSGQLVIANGITAVLDTNGNDVSFATPIGNASTAGLTKAGAGTLTLAGANTYTGVTRVAGGTLAIAAGGALASPAVTIASGGALAGEGTAPAVTVLAGGTLAPGSGGVGTLTMSSVVFGTASGDWATIPLGVTVAGGLGSSLQVTGDVTANGGAGSVTFAFGSGLAQLTTGTYALINYTGTQLTGVSAFGYSGSTGARQGVAVANGTQAVNLVISNAFPIWSGTAGASWSATDNWTLSSTGLPTSFLTGDTVVFSDAAASGLVTITQSVAPTTTTFSNETLAYTVSGSSGFGISSGSLVKSGLAPVTLATANSYADGTTLSSGALLLGDDAALGTGGVTITGGWIGSSSAAPRTLANAITFGGNLAVGAQGTGGVTLTGPVGLGGGVRQIDVGANVRISGTITNGGLVKTGGGTLTLAAENAYAGGTTIVTGTVIAASTGALGTGGTATINTWDTAGDTALLVDAPAGGVTLGRPLVVGWSAASTTIGSVAFAAGGEAAFTGGMTLTKDVTLVGADGGTTRFSGDIGGTGNVTVATAGTGLMMFSSGSSGFVGDVTVTAGSRLQLGDGVATALPLLPETANVTLAAGAVLRIAKGGNNQSINALLGSGTVEAVSGADTLTLVGAGGVSGTFAGVIREAGGTLALTKQGGGTQTFTAANTYSRATTLTEGTLEFTTDNRLGSNLVNANNVTSVGTLVRFGGNTLTIGVSGSNTTGFYYGKLDGSGLVRLAGGTSTIVTASGTTGAANNYQIFANAAGTPLSPTAFALDTGASAADRKDFGYQDDAGGVLTLSSLSGYGAIRTDLGGAAGSTVTRAIVVDQASDTTFNGALVSHRSAAGAVRAVSLSKSGSGSLTLAGFVGKQTASSGTGASPVDLTVTGGLLDVTNPANTATTNADAVNIGAVTVTSGTLGFATNALLHTSGTLGASSIVMNGGVLRWDAGTTQDMSAGGRLRLVDGQTATFDTNGNDVTLATPFVGGATAAVTKAGGGVLRLVADTAYTGPTSVLAGTLRVDGNAVASTGAVIVASGAALAGSGTLGGATTISTGATISPGASPGTLSFAGDLTWNAGGNYNWQMLSGTGSAGALDAWDLVSVTGTLAIAATSTSPFQLNLWTLASIGPDVSGSAANFSSTQSYTWRIASAAGGITGFAADRFVINASATNGTGGFSNSFAGGTFSIAQSGNDLNLVFTGGSPPVITIDVASGTQTQTQAGYPTLSGSTPVVKTGGGTLVLDQANTLTGSTTVQGGVVRLANASALSTSRLVVVAGGTGQLAPFATTAVAGLDLATGNGLMDVTNGSLTILGGMTAPELVAELLEGRADGSWTGTSGITSSTAAADIASSQPRAVGWLDNGDGTFTVAYAAPGDTNIDWAIDILDASNFLALGKFDTGLPATWIEGDFSYDGIVDILDAADFFATGLYDVGTYNAASGAAGVAAVPEPVVSPLVVLLTGVLCMGRRRLRPAVLSLGRSASVLRPTLAVCLSALMAASAPAADVIKANNTNALNLGTSWTSGTALTSADVAVWNNTVTAANTVALGGSLSWAGVRIANPGGAVVVQSGSAQTLTLGTSGIDMSSATQNMSLMTAAVANTPNTLIVGSGQTWNVASGRNLTLFSTSNSANQRLSGSGNLAVIGGGTVTMNVGDAGSATFTAGNGNDTYTGNWTISGGSKVISLRNGSHAFGQGTITLDNGIISQQQGNWNFANAITVAAGGGTFFSDSSGNNRYMNLSGVVSGTGPITFNAIAAMTTQEGFILTGSNTFTGPMTIAPNGTVRIGGDATSSLNSTAAGTLGSIDPAVAITNNGILGFGWTNAQTFANAISGTGLVRLGRSGGTLPTTQVVTLTAASTYTGTTQVNAGRLNLAGSLTSPVVVASGAKVSGTGSTTGLLTLASGGGLVLAGGTTTTSLTANGATFGGSNLVTFLADPTAGGVYDVFTYGLGAVTNPGNLSVAWRGVLADDPANKKYVFTAGASGTRTWNTTSGTWVQGVAGNWTGGDGIFYSGDTAVFDEPAAPSTVTLGGQLVPSVVIVNNTTNTYTISGTAGTAEITGGASLVKNGAGTLVITTAQTYTGTTAVNAGSVDVGNGGATGSLGSGPVSVAAGADLAFNRSSALTVANVLSGAGTITKKGAGRMTVSGSNAAGPLNWNFTGTGNGDVGFANAAAVGGTGSTITVQASGSGSAFFGSTGNSSDVAIAIGSGGAFTWNGSTVNTNTLTGPITGSGTFTKVSGETLILAGTSTFTGQMNITAGRLVLNGALPAIPGYTASAGSTLGGSGSLGGTIGGAGLVSPGSSPGILTAGAVDPSASLLFAFEFTGTGSPAYGSATASVNDVLRLTGSTPFTTSLASANVVDVYLQLATVSAGDVFGGGFYADAMTSFSSSLDNATFNIWVLGNGAGTNKTFNGQGYYSLATYDPAFTVARTTVADTATFADGTVNGGVMQLTIVPEPGMLALGGSGLAVAVAAAAARRRRCRG